MIDALGTARRVRLVASAPRSALENLLGVDMAQQESVECPTSVTRTAAASERVGARSVAGCLAGSTGAASARPTRLRSVPWRCGLATMRQHRREATPREATPRDGPPQLLPRRMPEISNSHLWVAVAAADYVGATPLGYCASIRLHVGAVAKNFLADPRPGADEGAMGTRARDLQRRDGVRAHRCEREPRPDGRRGA